MTKILQTSGDFAYVEKNLGSAHADVWVTIRLYLDAASLALWETIEGSANFIHLETNGDNVFVSTDPGWATGWAAPAGAPVGGQWLTVELHHQSGTHSDLYVDGALVTSATPPAGTTQTVDVGQYGTSGPTVPSLAYVDWVKVGTTRGGTDLFADDFESGNLSAWTSSNGDVSVIDDPFTPVPAAPTLDTAAFDADTLSNELAWTDGSDGGSPVTAQSVYRSTVSGSETLLVTLPAAARTYTDAGVDGSTTYYYKVTASNVNGESALSNELSVTVPTLIQVFVATGLNPDEGGFILGNRSGAGASEWAPGWPTGRGTFDVLTLDDAQQTQLMNARITQTGPSAQTEVYSLDIAVRPMPGSLEGGQS